MRNDAHSTRSTLSTPQRAQHSTHKKRPARTRVDRKVVDGGLAPVRPVAGGALADAPHALARLGRRGLAVLAPRQHARRDGREAVAQRGGRVLHDVAAEVAVCCCGGVGGRVLLCVVV